MRGMTWHSLACLGTALLALPSFHVFPVSARFAVGDPGYAPALDPCRHLCKWEQALDGVTASKDGVTYFGSFCFKRDSSNAMPDRNNKTAVSDRMVLPAGPCSTGTTPHPSRRIQRRICMQVARHPTGSGC